jgi:hypothetical protein
MVLSHYRTKLCIPFIIYFSVYLSILSAIVSVFCVPFYLDKAGIQLQLIPLPIILHRQNMLSPPIAPISNMGAPDTIHTAAEHIETPLTTHSMPLHPSTVLSAVPYLFWHLYCCATYFACVPDLQRLEWKKSAECRTAHQSSPQRPSHVMLQVVSVTTRAAECFLCRWPGMVIIQVPQRCNVP